MQTEIDKLHDVLVKPVLAARKYLKADKLVDSMLEVGLAVAQQAPLSKVLVKLTDLSDEFNKMAEANRKWVADRLDEAAVSAAFNAAVAAARPVIVPAKAGKPKCLPTAAKELQAKCKRKRG
jgi:hypothetical protein